ncbi:MAG TPA: cysteine desulfurase [Gemmatimonadales bacterium]|nr:cysteine desulfurase [Gemmatimonadales bacterium]
MTQAVVPALDLEAVRDDFPILAQPGLVYLDSAATSQKPRVVIEALSRYYSDQNANIHRGVYRLSQGATAAYDAVRRRAAQFLNARHPNELIFTRGTTESINLVAQSWGGANLRPGDEILISGMEHHSNIVPWQLVAQRTGARIVEWPITDAGELDLALLPGLLTDRTRLLAVAHVSNALGTVNPVEQIVAAAHQRGVLVLVDGAQSAAHLPVDLQAIDCDFFACSGHKMLGPTGIGLLYGRESLLDQMPPWQGGGDMIDQVSFEGSTWAPVPAKFEAGTPNIAGVVGLGAALDYLGEIGFEAIGRHEDDLLSYAVARLDEVPRLSIIGRPARRSGAISFVLDGVHPHDAGTILDAEGVAVRAGHHCAQPVMRRFGVPATVRASVALYNTRADIDALITALGRVRKIFG